MLQQKVANAVSITSRHSDARTECAVLACPSSDSPYMQPPPGVTSKTPGDGARLAKKLQEETKDISQGPTASFSKSGNTNKELMGNVAKALQNFPRPLERGL